MSVVIIFWHSSSLLWAFHVQDRLKGLYYTEESLLAKRPCLQPFSLIFRPHSGTPLDNFVEPGLVPGSEALCGTL